LPKTYETKRNRIGDEKREIRKKLSGELNLHGDPPLSCAHQQSQLSLVDEAALSPARWLSLSPEKTMKREKKKEKGKGARKLPLSRTPASRIPPAGEPAPSRRRAPSLSPRRDGSLSLFSIDGENNEREKKKERTRERERGDNEEKAISSEKKMKTSMDTARKSKFDNSARPGFDSHAT
jgi:hypothetical protein